MTLKNKSIYLPGHTGLVGSALQRLLHKRGCRRIITADLNQLDLRRQQDTEAFFAKER
ncbi:NAD-dependent epimerase/dehydratase family protein, partial [bacterium]|nr:NAD-dependent epimerase/dehydratase family protein [bacterium]